MHMIQVSAPTAGSRGPRPNSPTVGPALDGDAVGAPHRPVTSTLEYCRTQPAGVVDRCATPPTMWAAATAVGGGKDELVDMSQRRIVGPRTRTRIASVLRWTSSIGEISSDTELMISAAFPSREPPFRVRLGPRSSADIGPGRPPPGEDTASVIEAVPSQSDDTALTEVDFDLTQRDEQTHSSCTCRK